jgi:hypothetical protein
VSRDAVESVLMPDGRTAPARSPGRAEADAGAPRPVLMPGLCLASLDPALKITGVNGEFVGFVGARPAEVYGRDLVRLLHPRCRERVRDRLSGLVAGRHERIREPVAAAGRRVGEPTGDLTGIRVGDPEGAPVAVVVVVAVRPSGGSAGAKRPTLASVDARLMEGLAVGGSTVQLAATLYLSRQGVEYRITRLLRRFDTPNRAALVSRAYALGLLHAGSWPPKVPDRFIN